MEGRSPAMEGSCECTEQAVVDSRQGVVLQLGVGRGDNNSTPYKNNHVTKRHNVPPTWTNSLDKRPNLRKVDMRFGA
jgi:hypothetical protein